MSGARLPAGGRIDRTKPLRFTFDGRGYQGFAALFGLDGALEPRLRRRELALARQAGA